MTEPDVTISAGAPAHQAVGARRRNALAWMAGVLLLCMVPPALSYVLTGRPVARALSEDSRNRSFELTARHAYFSLPSRLVLQLRASDEASPADVFRGLFTAAATLAEKNRHFDEVLLKREQSTVFRLDGAAFTELGTAFAANENPVYLIRTLPPKLRRESGEPAFGEWTGGVLGVLGKQMEDANSAAQQWAFGTLR